MAGDEEQNWIIYYEVGLDRLGKFSAIFYMGNFHASLSVFLHTNPLLEGRSTQYYSKGSAPYESKFFP